MLKKSYVLLVLILSTTYLFGQETFRDNFSSVSYSNNNGTQNFSTNWIENGDTDNGPSAQYIRINSNRLELYYIWSENIRRSVDLSGATSATLSFDWQAISLGGSRELAIQMSNNGGGSYTTIGTITGGNNTGSFSQNISAYIASNTTIRFIKSGNNWRNDDYAFIDNFLISAIFPAPIPVIEVEDVTVNEDGGNATFTVTHTGSNASGAFTLTYQTSNGTATSGSDFTATSGTLSFNGNSGDTETFSVPILDDGIIEGIENFTIQFLSASDPAVDITDTAIGSIQDDDALVMTDGVAVNSCSDTFFDPGGLSNYNNNEDVVYTICPDTPDTYVNVDFMNFEVVSGDMLYIYEGTTTGGTLIGQYDSSNIPSAINSSDASGCLTFRFTSNGNGTGAGWEASINCYPEGPIIVIDDISFDEDVGNAIFTVRSTRAAHGRNIFLFGFVESPFTVDFQTVNGSALAGSDYTGTTGTLTFTGELNNAQTISIPIANDGIPEFDENFTIEFTGATAQYATVNYSDTGTGTINSQILANDPLSLFREFDGRYDYSVTGGSLRTQSNGSNPCTIQTTSSNQLISPIPNTATIKAAYLYWSHSNTTRDEQVTFEGQNVNAGFIYQTTLTNRNFYGYVSDVTSIVQAISGLSTNVFDFTDLDIDTADPYCGSATVLGGWSLMVFYEELSLPAVNINLYQGFDGLSNEGTSFTLDSFYAIAGSGAKATFLSWEGDPDLDGNHPSSTNPEALSITNEAGATNNLTGDGGQTGNNAYNSSIYDNTVGPVYNDSNVYGVDLDTYDISSFIDPGDTQVTANVDMGQDFVINMAVVLKVPSNLITGTVFEDVNYPGGQGRSQTACGGVGVSGAVVELFQTNGTFLQRKNTDISGNYAFGGMPDGDYLVKVVNSTVRSSRGGGLNCSDCYPVQTFRRYGSATVQTDVAQEIGGASPSALQDAALGILNNAQSVSDVTVASNGVTDIDFGFNFNTIVNTNDEGQGSLDQFIVNSNNLNETGLDIEANGIFDPVAGDDVSIFMIPPSGDSFGRTADSNFAGGYFDITIPNSGQLTTIGGTNTVIDGRTQTAYSGDTNAGNVGAGGSAVGTSAIALPNIGRPEIQVHRDDGDVITTSGNNVVIRNLAIFAQQNSGITVNANATNIVQNLIGVDAMGSTADNLDIGIQNLGGNVDIDGNYIANVLDYGIFLDGGTANLVQNNQLVNNGSGACDDGILLSAAAGGIQIVHNLIESSGSTAIDAEAIVGNAIITENSLTTSGQDGGNCSGSVQNMAIKLSGDGSEITNNIIFQNGGTGISLIGGNSNLVSQNSIYANGTTTDALGIDINNDGVTLNDNGDIDVGPNNSLNFPILIGAYVSGSDFIIEGWSRSGAIIELFATDINEGTAAAGENQLGLSTDYGEGQRYIATLVEGSGVDLDSRTSTYKDTDGNTDNTNRFKFKISLPSGLSFGNLLTSTATIAHTTSEFSPFSEVKAYTVITNRRITYRVKKN